MAARRGGGGAGAWGAAGPGALAAPSPPRWPRPHRCPGIRVVFVRWTISRGGALSGPVRVAVRGVAPSVEPVRPASRPAPACGRSRMARTVCVSRDSRRANSLGSMVAEEPSTCAVGVAVTSRDDPRFSRFHAAPSWYRRGRLDAAQRVTVRGRPFLPSVGSTPSRTVRHGACAMELRRPRGGPPCQQPAHRPARSRVRPRCPSA
jgi:hypothetical protein